MLYDCRQRKKRKTTQPNPALPSIHVHNHLPGSGTRIHANYNAPETPPPMSTPPPPTAAKRSPSTPLQQASQPAQSDQVIDLTNSDDDEDLEGIRYPEIPMILAELHGEYPALRFPEYERELTRNGFVYISQLADERVRKQLEDIGVSTGAINLLLSRAKRLMRRTQKLKQED